MKIKDLFEDQQHKTKASKGYYSGKLKQSDRPWSDEKSGVFSSVTDDKKDPHMVKKYHHGPLDSSPNADTEMDAYVYFALWLTKQNINNPCLPRIYDIKKIQDNTGKFIYKYQIEKLISGKELEIEQLWNIFDRYFKRGLIYSSSKLNKSESNGIIRLMGLICESYIIKGDSGEIKDDTLKEALDIISKFMNDYKNTKNFMLDIENSGNIMFRRGPYGYQLVLTDPVA